MGTTIQTDTQEQASVLNRLNDMSEMLRSAVASLQSSLDRVIAHLDEGYHVNSLGEIQGNGPALDVLCGKREQLAEVARIVGCDAEQITEASKGARGVYFVWTDAFGVQDRGQS